MIGCRKRLLLSSLLLSIAHSVTSQPAKADSVPLPPASHSSEHERREGAPPAAASMDHAPRAYGLMVGGSYAFRSRLPLTQRSNVHPFGLFAGVRFGWQVRGLAGGAPATVGFETDFMYHSARDARKSYGLRYGIFAKHALTARTRVRPYFCYGLGAAQVWVRGIEGRGIGHATRLGFGVDVPTRARVEASLALSYEGIIMPRFALDGASSRDTSFHAVLLSAGIWLGQ